MIAISRVRVERYSRRVNEDAVAKLMADIQQNGQRHPIKINKHNLLLDGLHRLEAMRRLGFRFVHSEVVYFLPNGVRT